VTDQPMDPVSTTPPTRPTFAPVADIFTAKQRTWIYLVTGMLAAAYAVAASKVDMPWWINAVYAAINFLSSFVAISNVPRSTGGTP
jgi:hypothetical protein